MAELNLFSMQDVKAEKVKFLWEPYIAEGKITIVQGDPSGGKTNLMLAVAAALTKGEILPGNNHVSAPANIIFQTAEDGLNDTIKPRLEKLGADCSRVYVIDETKQELSLTDDRIEQAIVKMDAKLLILDPLQAYLSNGANMNSTNGVRPLMKSLSNVAERTGCAIVIIGHLNKGSGKSQYRGLGSIDIYAAARSVLTVGKIEINNQQIRAVVHGKSNIAPPGSSLAFELDPINGFSWIGECDITLDELLSGRVFEKDESRLSQAMAFIKAELSAGEVAAAEMVQLATKNGIPKMTLDRAKQTLCVKSVKRDNKWYWTLTEKQDNQ